MVKQIRTVDASRGTSIWAFNRLRSDAFPQFLKDLSRLENNGFDGDESKYDQVRNALRDIRIEAAEIPDGTFFSKAIFLDFNDFENIYIKWNAVKGSDNKNVKKRKATFDDLVKKRQKISKKTRKHQYILAAELDLIVIDNFYNSFNNLVDALPDLFVNLAKAITRYDKNK